MADNGDREPKTCFVVMPITTPAAYAEPDGDPDHFAHVLSHLFRPALENLDYEVLPPSVAGSELIHAEIVKKLEQSDLVLCDLSSLNPWILKEEIPRLTAHIRASVESAPDAGNAMWRYFGLTKPASPAEVGPV